MFAPRFEEPCNGSKRSSTFPLSPDLSALPTVGRNAIRRIEAVRESDLAFEMMAYGGCHCCIDISVSMSRGESKTT
jgi:hypothetical protein